MDFTLNNKRPVTIATKGVYRHASIRLPAGRFRYGARVTSLGLSYKQDTGAAAPGAR